MLTIKNCKIMLIWSNFKLYEYNFSENKYFSKKKVFNLKKNDQVLYYILYVYVCTIFKYIHIYLYIDTYIILLFINFVLNNIPLFIYTEH